MSASSVRSAESDFQGGCGVKRNESDAAKHVSERRGREHLSVLVFFKVKCMCLEADR